MREHDGCVDCLYEREGETGEHCKRCKNNYKDMYKRATNADRIRSMTDEELAKELVKHHADDGINFCKKLKECDDILENDDEIPEYKCEKCLLEWLQKESDDN